MYIFFFFFFSIYENVDILYIFNFGKLRARPQTK